MENSIKVEVIVDAAVEEAWNHYLNPESVKGWNFASDDWCCPVAENEVKEGGRFVYRMEAKDGSFGFDFSGTFVTIQTNMALEILLDDNRKVRLSFEAKGTKTRVTEVFEAENQNPVELQQQGWQAILNNYKRFVEAQV